MRPPQPYRGRAASARKQEGERGGEYLTDLLKRWLRKNHVRERADPSAAYNLWKEVVGEEIAARTRVVDMSQGELVVEVDSAPLLNELSTYYRSEILETLKGHEEFKGVQKLRFRAGTF
jgi:hypothetical protein